MDSLLLAPEQAEDHPRGLEPLAAEWVLVPDGIHSGGPC